MRQPPENSRYGRLQLATRRSRDRAEFRRRALSPNNRRDRRTPCAVAQVQHRCRVRSASAMARSTRRNSTSPSSAQSSAVRLGRLRSPESRCAMRQRGGIRTSPMFRQQTAAQQCEQARLADAVAADERDVMAGMQRQVEVFEQHLAAALQRYVGDDDHGQTLAPPVLEETLERGNAILSRTADETRQLYCPMREMPDFQSFCDSLQDAGPPAGVSDELKAMWWARKGRLGSRAPDRAGSRQSAGRERACVSAPRRG